MFDDVNKQGKQTAPSGSQEPIDIFSEADASAPAVGEIMEEGVKSSGFPIKLVAIVAGAVVAVLVIGFGVYQFVFNKSASAPVSIEETANEEQPLLDEETDGEEVTDETQQIEEALPTPAAPEAITPSTQTTPENGAAAGASQTAPVVSASVDSDGDGLMDDQELKIGTDKNVVDTDNDGLSDREEAEVYQSNPLSPDTDNDGFSDGTEVKNGYNPNGAGKLITIPSAQQGESSGSAAPTPINP